MVTLVSCLQYPNVSNPMLLMDLPIETLESFVQKRNAWSPRVVTESGIVMLIRLLQ